MFFLVVVVIVCRLLNSLFLEYWRNVTLNANTIVIFILHCLTSTDVSEHVCSFQWIKCVCVFFSSDVWMYDHYSKICFGPADSNLNVFCNQFGCYFRDLISPWKITLHLNFEMWDCSAECWRYDVLCCSMMWWCLVYWLTLSCMRSHAFSLQTIGIDSVLLFFLSLIHFGWLLLKSVWATAFWISSWQNDECNATMAIILFDRFLVLSVQYLSLSVLSEWICFCHRLWFFFSVVKQLNSMMHCCC